MSVSEDSYKLISFNAYDYKNTEEDTEGGNTEGESPKNNFKKNTDEFRVQMFGINEKGETASIFLEGYSPFFYVLVGKKWTEGDVAGFKAQIIQDIGKYYEDSIVSTKLVEKKKLYGFDAGRLNRFMYISFKSESAMRKVKNLWYDSYTNKSGEYIKVLMKDGYEYNGEGTYIYEAQIPPLLRLFHINEISPSGWVSLPKNTLVKNNKTTTCTYEYIVDYKKVVPLPQKETRVPYKICSFDIEASSSHGDFPLAVKNYKKLATNIVDVWQITPPSGHTEGTDAEGKHGQSSGQDFLKSVINTAFGFAAEENIDKVYPIAQNVDEKSINTLFDKWIKIKPAVYKNTTTNNDDADEVPEANADIDGTGADADVDADTVGEDAESDDDADAEGTTGVEEIAKKKKRVRKK
jgi:hypothetical protein